MFVKMFRVTSLPILLFIISTIYVAACFGQTFQYSRGWTNGKRSQGVIDTFNQQQHLPRYLQKKENGISTELYDDRLLERCLLNMRNLLGRTALYSAVLSSKPTPNNSNSNNNIDNNNNNNLLSSRHQSSELFDDLNGAIETNDYGKH